MNSHVGLGLFTFRVGEGKGHEKKVCTALDIVHNVFQVMLLFSEEKILANNCKFSIN